MAITPGRDAGWQVHPRLHTCSIKVANDHDEEHQEIFAQSVSCVRPICFSHRPHAMIEIYTANRGVSDSPAKALIDKHFAIAFERWAMICSCDLLQLSQYLGGVGLENWNQKYIQQSFHSKR